MLRPILPHEFFGADCCGCLVEEILDDGPKFTCNECGEPVPVQDVQRVVLEMESTEATCPHCGHVNQIDGFPRCSHSSAITAAEVRIF